MHQCFQNQYRVKNNTSIFFFVIEKYLTISKDTTGQGLERKKKKTYECPVLNGIYIPFSHGSGFIAEEGAERFYKSKVVGDDE